MTQVVCWSKEDYDRILEEVDAIEHAIADGVTGPGIGAQRIVDRMSAIAGFEILQHFPLEEVYAQTVRPIYKFWEYFYAQRTLEEDWGEGSVILTDFVRHYLPLKTGERPEEDWVVSHP